MLCPFLLSRLIEGDDDAANAINTGEVRSVVKVAADAGEREIFCDSEPAVLSRDDVLNLERRLWVSTSFTAPTSATPNKLT